jgi:GTPase
VFAISSATGHGLEELVGTVFAEAEKREVEPAGDRTEGDGFETEHRVYRPAAADGFRVHRLERGGFEVAGRGIEMLVDRHDLGNPEAISYLERRLIEIGVVKALRKAGFQPGDEVRIGEQVFEFDPGD